MGSNVDDQIHDVWHYTGKFNKGEVVTLIESINVGGYKDVKFKDIFSKHDTRKYFDVFPNEKFTVYSRPIDTTGGGISGCYYPGTYTLQRENGEFIIGIPEYLLRGLIL